MMAPELALAWRGRARPEPGGPMLVGPVLVGPVLVGPEPGGPMLVDPEQGEPAVRSPAALRVPSPAAAASSNNTARP